MQKNKTTVSGAANVNSANSVKNGNISASEGKKPLEITVMSGIPIPSRRGGREVYGRFFRDLVVGESIFLSGTDPKKASAIASHWKHKLSHNYTVRDYVDEKGVKGAMIWRVEDKIVA